MTSSRSRARRDELSIVGASDAIPADLPQEGPWRAFKVQGPLVMTLIGVVAAIADPLRDAGIAIFAISSFDTDYVLVHEPDFDAAVTTLTAAGHEIGYEVPALEPTSGRPPSGPPCYGATN